LEELRAASRRAATLRSRIAEMETEVAERSAEFLAKRMERRQVETLISKTEAAGDQVARRRAQWEIDDWFMWDARRGDPAAKKS
jgi:hypothetical protein